MQQLNKQIDDWFIGYKTHAVKPKRSSLGGGSNPNRNTKPFAKTGLKSGTGLKNLQAAAAKKPEVMVKIAKCVSKNSKGINGVQNHMKYISRNGELPLETRDGDKVQGNQAIQSLMNHWQKSGIRENSDKREAINIVLSMPAGTPPQAVLNAARQFAAEQFEKHEYAFVLHHESERDGEPPHPHVHLCVMVRDYDGIRLNPRKNDLFEWRVRFAEKMREQGVECTATRRQHRGQSIKGQKADIRQIILRTIQEEKQGKQPENIKRSHIAQTNVEAILEALQAQQRPQHPFQGKAQQAKDHITEQYSLISRELYKLGYKTEAKIMKDFAKEVSGKSLDTQAQQIYDRHAHSHQQSQTQISEPKAEPKNPSRDDWEMER